MNYSTFEKMFLVAAYLLSEETGDMIVDSGAVLDKYSLSPKPNWVLRAVSSYKDEGYTKGSLTMGGDREQPIYLSAAGVREAERLHDSGLSPVYAEIPSVKPITIHDAVHSVASTEPDITSHLSTVQSVDWTGKQFVLVDAKVIATVQVAARDLHQAVHSMRFQSNEESDNLKGLADALVAICEMAEPDVTIIDRILASPKFLAYAGLLTFIATIRGAIGL